MNARKEGKLERAESSKLDAFLSDIVAVCRKHRLTIAHEDMHGGFRIARFSEANIEWLESAGDATEDLYYSRSQRM